MIDYESLEYDKDGNIIDVSIMSSWQRNTTPLAGSQRHSGNYGKIIQTQVDYEGGGNPQQII